MNYRRAAVRVGLTLLLLVVPLQSFAVSAAADVPPLSFREAKITGDEFVVLQAGQDVSLSDYWLGYTGSDTAVAPPLQQLPDVSLAAGQAILLNKAASVELCGVSYVAQLSPSLSDTKGTLNLWSAQATSFTRLSGPATSVVWAKSTKTNPVDTATHSIDLAGEGSLTNPAWYIDQATQTWAAANVDSDCTLTVPDSNGVAVTMVSWPQNDIDPPAIIEALASDDSISGPYLPAADVGLLPPQITELLPNPTGTGNDGTDEFIELYNPNAGVFDLGGFTLQTGLTTKHSYVFSAGTMLAPRTFAAFFSADTGLSLSNTSGQADLEDPFGTVINQTDPYGTAKDGQTWAFAKGTWYWTGKSTPNSANIINQITTASKSGSKTAAKSKAGSVKGTSTSSSAASTSATTAGDEAQAPAPLHPFVLAAVAALAVGYGVYEYRHDLANAVHLWRTNRAARRAARK